MDLGFSYLAGQFLTFRLCGTLRSYSMSSSPDTDGSLMVTVKRVPGGLVSGWMHEHLGPGDVVEVTPPAGVFCLRDTAAPMVAFGAGSGITPILSLVKSALAVTDRRVRVLTANRDSDSVIFRDTLGELAGRYPGRLEIRHHLDEEHGFVTGDQVREFAGVTGTPTSTVCIVLARRRHTVPRHAGESLLESARRAGLSPPFSCEAGNCATCIAQVTEGEAKMRANNALDDDEIADGWVLTCQGEPVTPHVTVVYED